MCSAKSLTALPARCVALDRFPESLDSIKLERESGAVCEWTADLAYHLGSDFRRPVRTGLELHLAP
jgi:hypothetical protein